MEIYNENVSDLLDPSSSHLQIREDMKKGVYVEGVTEEIVQGEDDLIDVIKRGTMNRHVGSTAMNKDSSRSHAVLVLKLESKVQSNQGIQNIKSSTFHLIDLAGSERSKLTKAKG